MAEPRVTFKTAQAMCRALGCSIRKRDGEYRVAYLHGTLEEREARAYYTNDLRDACDTANAMHDWTLAQANRPSNG